MKTQISFILLGLGLVCGSLYAANANEISMPVSNDINVVAPDQSGAWSFGATAVLMQPTSKAFQYATQYDYTENSDHEPINEVYTPLEVAEHYYWWFGADVTYAFPGNGRDVTLAYEGLHGSNTDSASDNYDNNASGITEFHYLMSTLSDADLNYIQAKEETLYDAGDLIVGQKLNVGTRIRLHPFMGLRYVHIEVKDSYNANLTEDGSGVTTGTENGALKSTFDGIGLRLGSDAAINLGQGFSVRGRLGLSALIGSQKSNFGYDDIYIEPLFGRDSFDYQQNNDAVTRVIPEIDGRLGLNYTYNFNTNTALGFEAGWQATEYFQVVANPNITYFTGYYNDIQANPPREVNSNFGLQGPYARIQLDVA